MKKSTSNSTLDTREYPPARTPEAREEQMIALAIDLAEKQLREGTASSQVISHFLKLGSSKERIEKDILKKQEELISAKTEAIQSAKRSDQMYEEVLNALMLYSGKKASNDDDSDEEY